MMELEKYKSKTCPGTEHFNFKMMNQLVHEVTIQEVPVAAPSTVRTESAQALFSLLFFLFIFDVS